MLSDNPFQTHRSSRRQPVRSSYGQEYLRSVATYQKGILICILIYIAGIIGIPVIGPFAAPVVGVASLVGAVFVFLLAFRIFGGFVGFVLGVLTLIPCIGLIALLVVNGKATSVLRQHGIKVGLLGANLSNV